MVARRSTPTSQYLPPGAVECRVGARPSCSCCRPPADRKSRPHQEIENSSNQPRGVTAARRYHPWPFRAAPRGRRDRRCRSSGAGTRRASSCPASASESRQHRAQCRRHVVGDRDPGVEELPAMVHAVKLALQREHRQRPDRTHPAVVERLALACEIELLPVEVDFAVPARRRRSRQLEPYSIGPGELEGAHLQRFEKSRGAAPEAASPACRWRCAVWYWKRDDRLDCLDELVASRSGDRRTRPGETRCARRCGTRAPSGTARPESSLRPGRV